METSNESVFNNILTLTFNMTDLELWKEKPMKIHFLFKPQMEVGYHNCGDIP